MRGFIANTHHDWFDFLAREVYWEEVNFWSPSDFYSFRGEPGTPFFFRLKSPRNAIGGFGIVAQFEKLPEWLAWECFERGNGAPSLDEFQDRLQLLRISNKIQNRGTVAQIGCTILSSAIFFPKELWIKQPNDWGSQNLRYKGYDLTSGEGLRIWKECQEHARLMEVDYSEVKTRIPLGNRYGEPILIVPRLGQRTFRLAVTAAYSKACAVTGEHSLPVLEAAHIKPYKKGGEHLITNGILLRSDLHRLFDKGYMTITPDLRIEVSRRLKLDYSNGHTYYPLHGHEIRKPKVQIYVPDKEYLKWHNNNVFRAA